MVILMMGRSVSGVLLGERPLSGDEIISRKPLPHLMINPVHLLKKVQAPH